MSGAPRSAPLSALWDHDVRLIVAGSRGYTNYVEFSNCMWDYLEHLGDQSVIFISGVAKTGADALIVRFCQEHHMPWVEFPADWEKLGKKAGYARNTEMAKVGSHLLTFWDGFSRGTRHMVDEATKRGLDVTTILINTHRWSNPLKSNTNHWKGPNHG